MLDLSHDDKSVITLGELRRFLIEDCKDLPDDTPIDLINQSTYTNSTHCVQVLADEESVEFYDY